MKSDGANKQNRFASSGDTPGRKKVMEAIIGQVRAAQEDDENVRNAVTVYEQIRENRALEHELTQSYFDVNDDQEKTVGLAFNSEGIQPVVGWLVCEDGPEKGRSYILRKGRNFLGRSFGSDISVSDDQSISRENHCSIIFEPQSCCFYIYPSENAITILNGAVIKKEVQITDEDTIKLGNSMFRMIPYCKEGRVWK